MIEAHMSEKNERLQILEMIDNGTITPAEGTRLLNALSDISNEDKPSSKIFDEPNWFEQDQTSDHPDSVFTPKDRANNTSYTDIGTEPEVLATPLTPPDVDKWRRWWAIPLWFGVGITVMGGALMYAAMQSAGAGSFWFACAWMPFLLGIAVIVIAWSSRTARWIHIRVRQRPGERPQTIALSFPIPIRLTAWILRHFGRFIPNMDHTGLDEIILALGDKTSPETPFYVEVDEGENGEKVEIYIG